MVESLDNLVKNFKLTEFKVSEFKLNDSTFKVSDNFRCRYCDNTFTKIQYPIHLSSIHPEELRQSNKRRWAEAKQNKTNDQEDDLEDMEDDINFENTLQIIRIPF